MKFVRVNLRRLFLLTSALVCLTLCVIVNTSSIVEAQSDISVGLEIKPPPEIGTPDFEITTQAGGKATLFGDYFHPRTVTVYFVGAEAKTIDYSVTDPYATSWSITEALIPGDYYAQVKIIDTMDRISPLSNIKYFHIDEIIVPPATCTDNVQNGDESGVDCGGSCTSCPVPPTPREGLVCDNFDHLLLSPQKAEINIGEQIKVEAQAYDSSNQVIPSLQYSYSARGGTVDGSGLFTARETAGVFQINATSDCGGIAHSLITVLGETVSPPPAGTIPGEESKDQPKVVEKIQEISKSVNDTHSNGLLRIIAIILAIIAILLIYSGIQTIQITLGVYLSALSNYLSYFFALRRRTRPGKVYDYSTGKGVSGVLVTLLSLPDKCTVGSCFTNTRGYFRFAVLPGKYSIIVAKNEYIFPSRHAQEVSDAEFMYAGQTIETDSTKQEISVQIPLDRVETVAKAAAPFLRRTLLSSTLRLIVILAGSIIGVFMLWQKGQIIDYAIILVYLILMANEQFLQNRRLNFS